MARILSFTRSPDDWKVLLADPKKHWKTGYSAKTLAHCWEDADGFPAEVQATLTAGDTTLLANIVPLLAVPEFKVPLPGGDRASQNDVFVLARSTAGAIVIMVEGKVEESFDKPLGEWKASGSDGKLERLRFLKKKLALAKVPDDVKYQLLHRAASAIITAEQFRASAAVLLIHTFTRKDTGWTDYSRFLELFGVEAQKGTVQELTRQGPVPLLSAWVAGNHTFLER